MALVAVTVGIGLPANAATTAQVADVVYVEEAPPATDVIEGEPWVGTAACNGDTIRAYGKQGCKKRGTAVRQCYVIDHWEYFHIAPSGSIWHIWNGASSWKEMPHDGQATNTYGCAYNSGRVGNGVAVLYGNSIWYSYQKYNPANVWYGWFPV
ncbi:hypothetical protein WEI85_31675 [Actinomycetes bacterium KLBMP 9797]